MQSTSWETLGWKKQELPGEISITSDMQMIPSLWKKVKWNSRTSWWRRKRRVKKLAKNSAFRKRRSWHPVPSLHGTLFSWENKGNNERFYFAGLQNHEMVTAAMKLKDTYLLLGRKAMTNLNSILKSRDITLPTKVHIVKAMVFPVVIYGCQSWTIKRLSIEELMLLNCGVVEDSWESLGLQGDPTGQS